MGRYDEAIADYDAALQIEPNKVASLYGRGMAKRRKGDYSSGNIDIAAAKAIKSSVVAEFSRYGLLLPLTDAVRSDFPTGRSGVRPRPEARLNAPAGAIQATVFSGTCGPPSPLT